MKVSSYLEHVTIPNERWDHLADRYYGDANRVSALILANRDRFEAELLPIPAVLEAGLTLRIPVLEADPLSPDLLPPWKRGSP